MRASTRRGRDGRCSLEPRTVGLVLRYKASGTDSVISRGRACSRLIPTGGTMAEAVRTKSPPDRSRVDVDRPQDRRYWAHKFGVTEEELRKAVATVGPKAAF